MSAASMNPSSEPPPISEELEEERSEVRARVDPRLLRARTVPPPPPALGMPAPAVELVRGDRVERKIRSLRLLVLQRGEHDPAQRLVRLAIVRRDETLLDRLIEELARPR